ncbi:MAG: MBL fold metallo-hydrolase [Calditerrivibrio sp.]|nr:MBL fold metallo-hydrolase [Calditerrivibrio sp.]
MIQHTVNTPFVVGPVHFYSTEMHDGTIVMFDTGPHTPEASTYISKHVDLSRLSYLFITHCHIDHYGMLYHIKKNTNARIFISRYDQLKLKLSDERVELISEILAKEKFPYKAIKSISSVSEYFRDILPFPEAEILEDHIELIEKLHISFLHCPGHTQSDIDYLYQNYAITGDVILRDIFQTPLLDIDLDTPNNRYNNYLAFLNTVEKLMSIKDLIFLPGHNITIDNIKYRIECYLEKFLSRVCKIGPKLLVGDVYSTLKHINIDPFNNPFISYLKTSEIFFMRDIILNPEPLKKIIEKYDLNIEIFNNC